MKKIIAFFMTVYSWFLSLFKKKESITFKEIEKKVDALKWSNPQTPDHNNRKVKKGRYVQYINTGYGRQRAIYHSSK